MKSEFSVEAAELRTRAMKRGKSKRWGAESCECSWRGVRIRLS
jgi:hypothetical protein